MAIAAKLAGHTVTSGTVTLPAWGAWFADVELDGDVSLSGQVDLTVNDITLKGTVLSGGPIKGRSPFRIVGGKGGWSRTLKRRSYANDAGVKLSTVLVDAANEAGESLDASSIPATRVGPAFVRPAEPACRLLEQLASSAWYISSDGITRIGVRPDTNYTDTAPRIEPVDLARGRIVLAAETLAKLVPGAVIDGLKAVDVVHDITAKGLRTTVWGKQAKTSRTLEAFRAIFDQLDPNRAFRGVSEYRVVTQSGNRLDLQPVLVSSGMPDLQRVPVRAGIPGAKADVALGSSVLVAFVNSNPGRPVVVGFEDPDGEGWAPTSLTLCGGNVTDLAGGTGRVVRYGDPIVFATPGPGVVSAGAVLTNFSKVKA